MIIEAHRKFANLLQSAEPAISLHLRIDDSLAHQDPTTGNRDKDEWFCRNANGFMSDD
jgi:hypothetical protein